MGWSGDWWYEHEPTGEACAQVKGTRSHLLDLIPKCHLDFFMDCGGLMAVELPPVTEGDAGWGAKLGARAFGLFWEFPLVTVVDKTFSMSVMENAEEGGDEARSNEDAVLDAFFFCSLLSLMRWYAMLSWS